jgi:hypothetical protein
VLADREDTGGGGPGARLAGQPVAARADGRHEPLWRYRRGTAGEGAAQLRVWLTAGPDRGHLAVVTGAGTPARVTESAGHIGAGLARRYGPCLVLRGPRPAPRAGDGAQTLDLVRAGAGRSPHWLRVRPAPQDHPRHAGLERWLAVPGYQIVSEPASRPGRCREPCR